jgi:hypothetical protein
VDVRVTENAGEVENPAPTLKLDGNGAGGAILKTTPVLA